MSPASSARSKWIKLLCLNAQFPSLPKFPKKRNIRLQYPSIPRLYNQLFITSKKRNMILQYPSYVKSNYGKKLEHYLQNPKSGIFFELFFRFKCYM